jgi:CRP/FNR family transcriptional regulator
MVQVSSGARNSLFADLSDQQVDEVLNLGRSVEFKTGEMIIRRGDQGDVMYLILSGMVEVIRILGAQGPQFTRYALGEGEFFGEIALLVVGQTRTANVVALEPTTCLMLNRPQLEQVLNQHPAIAIRMLAIMSNRLRALGP